LEGKRTGLVEHIFRLSEETSPAFIFLENVPGIRTRGAKAIVERLAKIGYDCRWTVVSASELGAIHQRERWFLLAAHADNLHLWQQSGGLGRQSREDKAIPSREKMANTDGERWGERRPWKEIWGRLPKPLGLSYKDWPKEIPEPSICRVDDGISTRVDQLRALGNAVVPIQAKEAFKRLMGLT
jgi:DNA (cytosine-5)-methyltransferase 1